ncbi:hypothetical protein G7Y79_00022g052950 [Physcia stellaris]|nr:hypothetical protein G7Y79_00022g052950 [Physcia stellaris]
MSSSSAVLGLASNGTAAIPIPSPTGDLLPSTFGHIKDAVSSTLPYFNPSPKDLVMAVPRLLAHLGFFAFVVVPERIDYLFHLPNGGSAIAEATANRTQAMVSAAISSAATMSSSAGGPAATETAKAGLLSQMGFQHVRSFGGVFSYLTSRWALGTVTLSDQESCVATGMIRESELSPPSVGSLSLLWPLFKTLCLSQWVDTASAALQGFKPLTETGMSIFEHSLAFAESEAMVSSQLGLSPWGFPKTNIAKNATASAGTNAQIDLVPISALYNRMNTAPEVLLIGLISSLNCLTAHILGVLGLQVLSPNPGGPESPTLQERIQAAHDNLQAHGQMQNFQIRLHDDFYSTLLRVGFSVLTVASEAVYLNEGQKIGVGALTWLENERLKELEEAKQSFSNTLSSGVADGITLTEDSVSQSPRDARVWTSGYGRERTTKLLKAGSYTYATRTGAGGVGAFQRGGRYIMVWEFFNGVFWLSMAWFATVLSKTLFPIGINWRPSWATRPSSQVAGPVKIQSHTKQPESLEFWILSEDGHLSLPKDNDVDVEGETKKRLKVVSDFWGETEERKLDNTLYDWWKNGGWWGEKDESGTYQQLDFDDEDTTSVMSMSTNHDTASEWESEDDGSRTPTQLRPSHQTPPSPGLPMDHAIDPSYLAQLLDPKNSEQRQEARMLAAHLSSDRILTRSQYQHDQKFEKAHVLTSTRHRPPGFVPSSPNGRLTPQEEAEKGRLGVMEQKG